MSSENLTRLIYAEKCAQELFDDIFAARIIRPGKTELEINREILVLANEKYGINKFWHKRIVRSGINTVFPYEENPPNRLVEDDDIVFLDFGPVFEEWEADYGRTIVIGSDHGKLKLCEDIENAWIEGREFLLCNYNSLTGADMYEFTVGLALKYGWKFQNEHCGHLVGEFPHENLIGDEVDNYLHPNNHKKICELDRNGFKRHWIYEVLFLEGDLQFGGFFEQLVY